MKDFGLPQKDFETPILVVLDQMGGQADINHVYAGVYELVKDALTEYDEGYFDIDSLKSSQRWMTKVRRAQQELIIVGLMRKSLQRGLWSMTQAGREKAARLSNK